MLTCARKVEQGSSQVEMRSVPRAIATGFPRSISIVDQVEDPVAPLAVLTSLL